jgi:hypothetical protein
MSWKPCNSSNVLTTTTSCSVKRSSTQQDKGLMILERAADQIMGAPHSVRFRFRLGCYYWEHCWWRGCYSCRWWWRWHRCCNCAKCRRIVYSLKNNRDSQRRLQNVASKWLQLWLLKIWFLNCEGFLQAWAFLKPRAEPEPSPSQLWALCTSPAHYHSRPEPGQARPEPWLLSWAGPCTSLPQQEEFRKYVVFLHVTNWFSHGIATRFFNARLRMQ